MELCCIDINYREDIEPTGLLRQCAWNVQVSPFLAILGPDHVSVATDLSVIPMISRAVTDEIHVDVAIG